MALPQRCVLSHLAYLKGDLESKDKFVFLKEPTCGVHEDRVCDMVNQTINPLFDTLRLGSTFNSIVKHHTKCLWKNWVDACDVHICQQMQEENVLCIALLENNLYSNCIIYCM